jgi:hypothetical protein
MSREAWSSLLIASPAISLVVGLLAWLARDALRERRRTKAAVTFARQYVLARRAREPDQWVTRTAEAQSTMRVEPDTVPIARPYVQDGMGTGVMRAVGAIPATLENRPAPKG